MQLKDLKQLESKNTEYKGVLADATGARDYEITVSGSPSLVGRVFEKAEFEITIDPNVSSKEAEARSREFWDSRVAKKIQTAPAETIESLAKAPPKSATTKNSLVISLRRVKGQGTWWGGWIRGLALPTGRNTLITLPPVCNCWGVVAPFTGDADLFLSLNSPLAAPVVSSIRGGTAVDTVAFGSPLCFPWAQFVPWFRVNGFRASVFDVGIAGFSVFP
jgi:hypothetical protein